MSAIPILDELATSGGRSDVVGTSLERLQSFEANPPAGGYSSDGNGMCIATDTGAAISCAKASLCSGPRVCACTATSCTSNTDYFVQFDAALREEGAQLEGTFNNATVRLERQ